MQPLFRCEAACGLTIIAIYALVGMTAFLDLHPDLFGVGFVLRSTVLIILTCFMCKAWDDMFCL